MEWGEERGASWETGASSGRLRQALHEQNTGKERGRVGRHGHHLLDSAQLPGQCHPRTGRGICSSRRPQVSGSTWGGAVSSGLCCGVHVYAYVHTHVNSEAVLGLHCSAGLSPAAENGSSSRIAGAGFSLWWLLSRCGRAPGRVGRSNCGPRAPGHRLGNCSVLA